MPEPVFFQHFQVDQNPDGGLRELGRGAMGITYKAFDTNLQCPVALKIINATLTDNERARERFLREARAAARLRHPNVATVLHLGKDDQSFFYAMEFIEGETLEAYVNREGRMAPALALEVVQQVARALGAAQNEGLVHRDIKPANLMLVRHRGEADDEGIHVKVIDFGLAKFIEKGAAAADSLNLTMAGGFVGSPYFASPEQVDEGEIDTRSDIYSLGATLWLLLAGEPPFAGSLGQVLAQHLQRPPPYEKLTALGIPEPVLALLRRMLAKAPEDRPADPAVLRREVTACLRAIGAATGSSSGVVASTDGLIAGQYLILGKLGNTGTGQLYQAQDRRTGGMINVLKIAPGLLEDPAVVASLERVVEASRTTPVAGLTPLHALERLPEGDFLVTGPIHGFNLMEVLRARGRLEALEVFDLVHRAAEILDASAAANREKVPVSLRTVHAHFDTPLPGEQARSAVLHSVLGAWPPFALQIDPIELQPPISQTLDANAMTLLPTRPDVMTDSGFHAAESPKAASLRLLAELVYELLGGTLPPPGSRAYPPLSSLSEASNQTLRAVLLSVPADARFASAKQFADELRQGAGRLAPSSAPPPIPGSSGGSATGSRSGSASGSHPGQRPATADSKLPPSLVPAQASSGSVAPPPLPPPIFPPQIPPNPPPGPSRSSVVQPAIPPKPRSGMNPGCMIAIGLALLAGVILIVGLVALGTYSIEKDKQREREHKAEERNSSPPDDASGQQNGGNEAGDNPNGTSTLTTPTPWPQPSVYNSPPPAYTPPPTTYQTPPPTPFYTTKLKPRLMPMLPDGTLAIASYRTRLSERDHRSSTGARLTLASDILRQDRANFYRFKDRDYEDQPDPLFANANVRSRLDGIKFPADVNNAIVNGTPFVQVDVYPRFVYVTILSP